ncbi:MAG: SusC/RagA family TonB-linked outer membrane protein [Tannerellaceae bacterium]|jgi:TonB-linked SusC/RagA family outer membrane protein|nr:SusC/RagA family TonB-linked outer membrane protein [Tannerellaceae bacterium]
MESKRKVIWMTLLLFCLHLSLPAQDISLNMSNVTVKDAMEKLKKEYGYSFVFESGDLNTQKVISVSLQNKSIDYVINQILQGQYVTYEIRNKNIIIHKKAQTGQAVSGPDKGIQGVITDVNGEPIAGAGIMEKGTMNGAVSDIDGKFSLKVAPGTKIVISYIGFNKQEITISNQSDLQIVLVEDSRNLDEVIVIGYGTVKKGDLTTAVSSISNKEIDYRPIISAAQAIQGKAAGVMVAQTNGSPDSELMIRVRGTTSFNGSNNPLYVVDGVPVDNLKFLSPTDIESMQVLKDASSAAIYGSRAANGVVIINTKSGAQDQAKVTFNTQIGISNLSNEIKSLNAAQYDDLMSELGFTIYGAGDVTDWYKEIYSTGVTQNYQVSISNGNEKMRYFFSAGYLDNKGIINSTFYNRYSIRAKVDNQVRKWLAFNTNISYSDYTGNGIATGLPANRGGFVLSAINLPTGASVWDETMGAYNRDFNGLNLTNPVEAMENGKNNRSKEDRLIASESLLISFLPELTLKTQFTLDRRKGVSTSFRPPIYIDEEPGIHGSRIDYGAGSDARSINTLTVLDNVLTYNKSFGKQHNVEAMVGTSWTTSDWSQNYVNATHFRNGDIHTLNAANKIAWNNAGSDASQWGIMSYFGRIAYNFESKYLLTANVRKDGSSKLHPNYRWGTFPSFSAAWRLSSEKFMEGLTWLDDLKVRGGWGQTGNQSGVGDYAYLQTYNVVRSDWTVEGHSNDLPSISVNNLRNRDLTWETTSQMDIGLDFTVFGNKLTVAMDYYNKRTSNMLMYVSLPAGQAASSIVRNEGVMTNKGFEFAVNSRNLQGAFTWTTDFNMSFNRNRLESLALQQVYYGAYINSEILRDNIVRNEPGRPLGGFYSYICEGVDPQTGELKYKDLDGKEGITPDDRDYIGDPNPDFIFGMTNTFSWKGFNLSVFLQGSSGNDIYNASKIETESMTTQRNQAASVVNRWRKPGDITTIPKAGTAVTNSSYYVEDGSYLRVKDVSLSYNFTGKFLKKIGVTRLQPYFTATNPVTFTNYSGTDPEVNEWGNVGGVQGIDWGTYPYSKTFVFGINVEF